MLPLTRCRPGASTRPRTTRKTASKLLRRWLRLPRRWDGRSKSWMSPAQLQSITKMQIQMMDQMMDVWEEQIKSPNPTTAPSAMLSKLKSLPGVPAGTWPNADAFAGAAMNPMQFWVQWAEQCQKAWADAVGVGIGGQR